MRSWPTRFRIWWECRSVVTTESSCGWRATDDQRTTLEENSHWRWLQHAQGRE